MSDTVDEMPSWGLPLVIAFVAATLLVGATLALHGLSFFDLLYTDITIEDVTATEGENPYTSISGVDPPIKVTLAKDPAELGIRHVYLYTGDGTRLDAATVGPKQRTVTFGSSDIATASSRAVDLVLVAVDGSNRIVSEVRIDLVRVDLRGSDPAPTATEGWSR